MRLQETAAGASPRLKDLSAQQWKSGLAAWLGWLFDGLDMHLYTLIAIPFVAILLNVEPHRLEIRQAAATAIFFPIIRVLLQLNVRPRFVFRQHERAKHGFFFLR